MVKNLKLNIKNAQIAQAINLTSLKSKLADKKAAPAEKAAPEKIPAAEKPKPKAALAKSTAKTTKNEIAKAEAAEAALKEGKEEAPKIRARSRSAFAEPNPQEIKSDAPPSEPSFTATSAKEEAQSYTATEEEGASNGSRRKTSEKLRKEIFAEELVEQQQAQTPVFSSPFQNEAQNEVITRKAPIAETTPPHAVRIETPKEAVPTIVPAKPPGFKPSQPIMKEFTAMPQRLGPTGRHVKDLLPQRRPERPPVQGQQPPAKLSTADF